MNFILRRRESCILNVEIQYRFLIKKIQTGGKAEIWEVEMWDCFQHPMYKRKINKDSIFCQKRNECLYSCE